MVGQDGRNPFRFDGNNLGISRVVVSFDTVKIPDATLPYRRRKDSGRRSRLGDIDPSSPVTFRDAQMYSGGGSFLAIVEISSLRAHLPPTASGTNLAEITTDVESSTGELPSNSADLNTGSGSRVEVPRLNARDLFVGAKADGFHLFQRVTDHIPKDHPLAFPFIVDFRDTCYRFNKGAVQDVDTYLRSQASSFDQKWMSDPGWLAPYVPRMVPAPDILLPTFDDLVERWKGISESYSVPLLNANALQALQALRPHLANGCFSDPPEELVQLYYPAGICRKTGLQLYRCIRGTNIVESFHQKLAQALGLWNAGPVLAHYLLIWFIWRWNITASENNVPGFRPIGHFDHGLIELGQLITTKLFGFPLPDYAWFPNTTLFTDTGKRVGFIAPGGMKTEDVLDEALIGTYPPGDQHLARTMGITVPPKPVKYRNEKALLKAAFPCYIGRNGKVMFDPLAADFNSGTLKLVPNCRIPLDKRKPSVANQIYSKTPAQIKSYFDSTYTKAREREEAMRLYPQIGMAHLLERAKSDLWDDAPELGKAGFFWGSSIHLIPFSAVENGEAEPGSIQRYPDLQQRRETSDATATCDAMAPMEVDLPGIEILVPAAPAINPQLLGAALHELGAAHEPPRTERKRPCPRCKKKFCPGSRRVASCLDRKSRRLCSRCGLVGGTSILPKGLSCPGNSDKKLCTGTTNLRDRWSSISDRKRRKFKRVWLLAQAQIGTESAAGDSRSTFRRLEEAMSRIFM